MEHAVGGQHRLGAGAARGRRIADHRAHTPRELAMHAMAVEFPAVHGHPNRLPFEGVLTLVDVASDKAPSGARGHRVVLTRAAAEAALPSLLGMAVDYKAGWDGHDARQKVGVITGGRGPRRSALGVYPRRCLSAHHRRDHSGPRAREPAAARRHQHHNDSTHHRYRH